MHSELCYLACIYTVIFHHHASGFVVATLSWLPHCHRYIGMKSCPGFSNLSGRHRIVRKARPSSLLKNITTYTIIHIRLLNANGWILGPSIWKEEWINWVGTEKKKINGRPERVSIISFDKYLCLYNIAINRIWIHAMVITLINRSFILALDV